MEIPPRFGYHLATEQNITGSTQWAATWGNNTVARYFFRFSPRYSLPLAGFAVYISATASGKIDGFLQPAYQNPLHSDQPLSPAGIDRLNLPSSPGRFVISDLHYNLQQGASTYAVAIRHGASGNVTVIGGPDFRSFDTPWHGFGHYGTALWSNLWAFIAARFNGQVLYRMPDGSIKFFEPLWTGSLSDEFTDSDLRVRFAVPEGVNIRVDGVVLSHFTKHGSPGGLKVVLRQGSTQLLESDPLPSTWNPPNADPRMSFYMPFLGSTLLTGGNTYELQVTVVGTHNSSNRFSWKALIMDSSSLPDWWTYRMVIGGTENWSKVPPMLLFTLDLNSPFS